MNKPFDQIEGSDWMTKQDREDFARYCYVYSKHIESMFGQFNWDNEEFIHFCKTNNIQKKGNKIGEKNKNHFGFNASKPKGAQANDFAHHFLRHIRNAFLMGKLKCLIKGKTNVNFIP